MADALASRAEEGRGKAAISLGELSSKLNRGYPNWATSQSKTLAHPAEHIGLVREPGELKHLSTPRKRNQPRYS
jgi:hypothetical protein